MNTKPHLIAVAPQEPAKRLEELSVVIKAASLEAMLVGGFEEGRLVLSDHTDNIVCMH